VNKKVTFEAQSGNLVKGKFIHEIKKYCTHFDIKVTFDETPAFLCSYFIITLEGEEMYVNHLLKEIDRIANQNK